MRIIARGTLCDFWEEHPETEGPLRAGFAEARKADWGMPADVKRDYPSASIVSGNRVVFNIKGNNYRLVTAIRYRPGIIYIRFVGTHADYDRIDAATV